MSDETIKLATHPSVRVIRRSEDYVVDGIGKVTALTAIDPAKAAEAKEAVTLFQGYAILGANVGGQIQPFPVEWLMDGVTSVEQAFEVFQTQAVAELKRNMDEARKRVEEHQKRIVTAPAGAVPKLQLAR